MCPAGATAPAPGSGAWTTPASSREGATTRSAYKPQQLWRAATQQASAGKNPAVRTPLPRQQRGLCSRPHRQSPVVLVCQHIWSACWCRLIAGTYTPLCMLALDRATATRLLCIEWGAAFLGMVRPRVSAAAHAVAPWQPCAPCGLCQSPPCRPPRAVPMLCLGTDRHAVLRDRLQDGMLSEPQSNCGLVTAVCRSLA